MSNDILSNRLTSKGPTSTNKPTHPPTDEQQQAINTVRNGTGSIMMDALAGTGKSTTLGMMGKVIRGPALALAFNKTIATALKDHFPPTFDVRTMNSLGYAALRRARPSQLNWKVDMYKVGEIIKARGKDLKAAEKRKMSDAWATIKKTTALAQLAALVPNDNDVDDWLDLAREAGADEHDVEYVAEQARETLIENNRLVDHGHISFDDQIYWPIAFGAKFPRFANVLVDEAQDLSNINQRMIEQVVGERLYVCGDPRQSIYYFRGSLSGSMEQLRRVRPTWDDLRLTLTFRCPKVVVERQQEIAPGYRAHESNAIGEFISFEEPEEDDEEDNDADDANDADYTTSRPKQSHWSGWGIEDLMAAKPTSRSTIAILCRNNAPLVKLAFKFLRRKIPIGMLGRDLGKGLTTLVKKLDPDGTLSRPDFAAKLFAWQQDETAMAMTSGREAQVEIINDRAECLRALLSDTRGRDDLIAAIDQLFSQENGPIVFGSIHKSKGLEWDVVVHLDPWRLPSKYARVKGGEELQQEWNLKYVCETRTKHTLIEANVADFT